jgi:hypothetical protein
VQVLSSPHTEKGQEFGDVIAAIEQFAQKNLSGLVDTTTAAQQRYGQRTQE